MNWRLVLWQTCKRKVWQSERFPFCHPPHARARREQSLGRLRTAGRGSRLQHRPSANESVLGCNAAGEAYFRESSLTSLAAGEVGGPGRRLRAAYAEPEKRAI